MHHISSPLLLLWFAYRPPQCDMGKLDWVWDSVGDQIILTAGSTPAHLEL